VQETAADDKRPMGIYHSTTESFLPTDFLPRAEEIFTRAMAMAENETTLRRVKECYFSIRYMKLAITPPIEDPELLAAYTAEVDAFFADIKAAGITEIKEWWNLERSREAMLRGDLRF